LEKEDTVVAALLFMGTIVLISRQILEEYVRVLAYPKFRLSDQEIRALVEEELLPSSTPSACDIVWPSFSETTTTTSSSNVPSPAAPATS
jgi:hypothetical protein